jgi:hypothetical protein
MQIFYYGKTCTKSKQIIPILSKNPAIIQNIHFICIDDRFADKNGQICVRLPTGNIVPLPEGLKGTPALLVSKQGYHPEIFYGDKILLFFQPQQEQAIKHATQQNMEPIFDCLESAVGGVISDKYSSLDEIYNQNVVSGNISTTSSQLHKYHTYQNDNGSGLLNQTITMKGEPKEPNQSGSFGHTLQTHQNPTQYNYGDMLGGTQQTNRRNVELPANMQPIDANQLRKNDRNIDSEMARFQQERENDFKNLQKRQQRAL